MGKGKRNKDNKVQEAAVQPPPQQQIQVDPARVINNLQRKLGAAQSEAAQWEAVAQSQGEQISALMHQVEDLEAQLAVEDPNDPEESTDS